MSERIYNRMKKEEEMSKKSKEFESQAYHSRSRSEGAEYYRKAADAAYEAGDKSEWARLRRMAELL